MYAMTSRSTSRSPLRIRVSRLLAAAAGVSMCLAVAGCPGPGDSNQTPTESEAAAVRRLLGDDYAGAKIVAIRQLGEDRRVPAGTDRDLQIVTIDLSTGQTRVVHEVRTELVIRGLSRPYWSPDGTQILYGYDAECWIMNADGSNPTRVITDDTVFDPSFWRDPATGELCVVYKNRQGRPAYTDLEERAIAGETYLYRLASKKRKKLFDFGCDGGLSLDGTHLGEAYGGCLMVDLRTSTPHVLFDDRQACQASISPDNTYRLMFLYVPHTQFTIHDVQDRELWTLDLPRDARQWETPRWSNHPDFCMAVAKFGASELTVHKLVLVRIEPKEQIVLDSFEGGWRSPHLWLPSAAPPAGAPTTVPAPAP